MPSFSPAGNREAKELFERCARNDSEAWGDFLRLFRPLLARLIARRLPTSLRDPSQVDEAISDIIAYLLRKGGEKLLAYDPAYRPSTWLALIAASALHVRVRGEARWKARWDPDTALYCGLVSTHEGPAEAAIRNEELEILHSVVSRLTTRERIILRLTYEEGLSHREICHILDTPRGTISSLLSRTRREIRSALARTSTRTPRTDPDRSLGGSH